MSARAPRLLSLSAVFAAVLAAFAPGALAQESPPMEVKSLESLLRQSEFMFRKGENGIYRIAVERDAGTMTVMAEEVTMAWKDSTGSEAKRIMIYCWIADTPEGFVANRALMEKVVEMNRGFQIGGIDQNKHGYFFTTGVWMRRADLELLTQEIYIAANTGADAIPVLQPLIEQSGQTKIAHFEDAVR